MNYTYIDTDFHLLYNSILTITSTDLLTPNDNASVTWARNSLFVNIPVREAGFVSGDLVYAGKPEGLKKKN